MTQKQIAKLKPEVRKRLIERIDQEINELQNELDNEIFGVNHKSFEDIVEEVRLEQPDKSLYMTK